MYFANGKQYEEHSPKNENIMERFVRREVHRCVTDWVEYILDTGTDANGPPFSYEDIDYNTEVACPRCGSEALVEDVASRAMTQAIFMPENDPGDQYVCPICTLPYPTKEEADECCLGEPVYVCADCKNIISQAEYDDLVEETCGPPLEWWAVSPWLCEQLADEGEIVIKSASVWGRTTSGQLIINDAVIQNICRNLGILEGQPNEWKTA